MPYFLAPLSLVAAPRQQPYFLESCVSLHMEGVLEVEKRKEWGGGRRETAGEEADDLERWDRARRKGR